VVLKFCSDDLPLRLEADGGRREYRESEGGGFAARRAEGVGDGGIEEVRSCPEVGGLSRGGEEVEGEGMEKEEES